MTTDLFIAKVQHAPMIIVLLAIVVMSWLVYRLSGRRRSDRRSEE